MFPEVRCNTAVKNIFSNWDETMLWSVLEGRMGKIYADCQEAPSKAAAVIGDFIFLTGNPDKDLLEFVLSLDGFPLNMCILMPRHQGWQKLIEDQLGEKAQKVLRYATKKNGRFDKEKLIQIASDSVEGIDFQLFDENLYLQALGENWSKSLVAQFNHYESYHKDGIGIAAVKGTTLVGGASSYSRYEKGVEIEIDTREDWRNKGIGRICGAKLILECLERGLYPSWDAQTPVSLRLAEKLGYESNGTYVAYELFF